MTKHLNVLFQHLLHNIFLQNHLFHNSAFDTSKEIIVILKFLSLNIKSVFKFLRIFLFNYILHKTNNLINITQLFKVIQSHSKF